MWVYIGITRSFINIDAWFHSDLTSGGYSLDIVIFLNLTDDLNTQQSLRAIVLETPLASCYSKWAFSWIIDPRQDHLCDLDPRILQTCSGDSQAVLIIVLCFFKILIAFTKSIYLFFIAKDLCCYSWAFSSCS